MYWFCKGMHKDTVCTEVILLIHFIKFEQKLIKAKTAKG